MFAAFTPDGKTLATGGRDAKVILWDVSTGDKRTVIDDHTAAVSAVIYSRDGKTLVTADLFDNTGTYTHWKSPPLHGAQYFDLTGSASARLRFSGGLCRAKVLRFQFGEFDLAGPVVQFGEGGAGCLPGRDEVGERSQDRF